MLPTPTRLIPKTPGAAALWAWIERRFEGNQREAAKALGIAFQSLNQILRGKGRRPGLAMALRIERVAGVPAGIWLHTQVSGKKRRKSTTAVTANKHIAYRHVG